MRTLWRTTASLIRKHPILSLPLILATIVNFNIRWFESLLQRPLTNRLLLWLTESHSVLGGVEHTQVTSQAMIRLALLAAPFELGTQFVCNVVLTSAFVTTAVMLQEIADTGRGTLLATFPAIAPNRRIFGFSLKLLGFDVLSPLLVGPS